MRLFNKKKSTDVKFEEEKKIRALTNIIRIFRNDKLKLPETDMSRAMIGFCDQIDPDHKMSERDLIQKLGERDDVSVFLSSINNGEILNENTIKTYAEKYYDLLRGVLSSPDPKDWAAWEYQSQQTIAILSLRNINIFREHLKQIMDLDATCPFYLKKTFSDMFPILLDAEGKISMRPTEDDEKIAENIMQMVCPGLDKSNKDVFRALVDSLKWRGKHELMRTLEAVNKTQPDKRKLRGRESCIFIESEDSVTYVG